MKSVKPFLFKIETQGICSYKNIQIFNFDHFGRFRSSEILKFVTGGILHF
jgi:hypothetical protein